MKIVFLDASTLGASDLSPLQNFGELVTYPTTSKEELLQRAQGARIVITNKVILDAETLARLPELKLICIAATGMNNVDLAYAKEHGISVRNVAGYSTASVAQHTLLLALALLGKLPYYDRYVKSGHWQKSMTFTHLEENLNEIEGKNWGIIGMGEIGRRVASLASAFGAKVSYHSTSGGNTAQPYPHKSLEALLEESGILSIHAPLNDQTRNLLDRSKLALLQEGAILLNLGRGGIVDEGALAQTMLEKKLFVGLDVLEKEPMSTPHPLLDERFKDNLIITPHVAWGYGGSLERLIAGITKNIEAAKSEEVI